MKDLFPWVDHFEDGCIGGPATIDKYVIVLIPHSDGPNKIQDQYDSCAIDQSNVLDSEVAATGILSFEESITFRDHLKQIATGRRTRKHGR